MAFLAPLVPAFLTSSAAAATGTGLAAGTAAGSAAAASAAAGAATAAGSGALAASQVPAWIGYTALGTSLLGGGLSAYGQMKQSQAQAKAAEYEASINDQNAQIAKENAKIAGEAAEQQTANQQQKNRATYGAITAAQGASGVDLNSDSSIDVRTSARELGELDALTVRSNATKEAYGYVTQSENFANQSNLDRFEAANAKTAGEIGAASTFLGAVGNAGANYFNWRRQGGFGF